MTDMRRTLLWVIFSMSLFFIYDGWNKYNGRPSFFSPAPARVAAPGASSGSKVLPGAVPLASGADTSPAGTAPVAAEETVVTTDVVKATLSSAGGSLVRLQLLQYPEQKLREWYEPLLELFGLRQKTASAPQDVVLMDVAPDRFYVAESGLIPGTNGINVPNHLTPMTLAPGERTLAPGQNSLQLRFESAAVGGIKLIKTYTFKRDDYVIGVKTEVVNESGAAISPSLYLQLVRDGVPPPTGTSFSTAYTGPAIDDGSKFQKIDFKSIDKRGPNDKPDYTTDSKAGWVAMVQHYFATAWLVDKGDGPGVDREYFTKHLDPVNPATGQPVHAYAVGMLVPLGSIAPGATRSFDASLFAGPQEETKLAALAPRLELVKDYGIFKIIAEPLFWLLTQLHKFLGNWGWSIVGLVVLLKIAFYWLNAKAYASMAKMKAVNPKIAEMRERLQDKPQEMQKEMMRIYREEKINPLGGCLPIFVQMPVFLALYWVLLSTVEMRGAPWIGWITDLSTKDPFFILPTLMMLTSMFQTWLNPKPADPVQAKMMWFMPLIFSGMFYVFPSGLVLYYLTNNILSIAQQYVINKRLGVLNK